MPSNIDVAVLIGRFQPFHQGHASLLTLALSNADKVIVVLGRRFAPEVSGIRSPGKSGRR
jgi:bifunctional NMN adenylyltransferase/nudix hydrolase